ncbi:hypothetical protein ACFFK0_17955 [Paenibacillus chartarius]|uniref:Flagellar hook-length control protein FliK n=1 Tax=Paenibacillus chartarius TaxID=747481 RepID=A0ABV6DNU2_9BACL
MNIAGLVRSMLGDMQAADAKTLELKIGQIVKGVILQMLSEQDALVNINGVQVRARLEAPLKQGDMTLLQVQPESASGQTVLKPLQSAGAQLTDASFPGLLKELGQPDTAANRQLVLTMLKEGVPLTKETVAEFAQAAKTKPAKVNAEEWSQTAAFALKRGLPLTGETLGALRQALNGAPLYELVQRLASETEAQLSELPPSVRQQAGQLAALVRQALGGAAAGLGGGDGAAPAQPALPEAAGAAAGAAGGGADAQPPGARAGAGAAQEAAGQRAAAATPGPAAGTPPQAPQGAAAAQPAPTPAAAAAPAAAGEAPPPLTRAAAQPQTAPQAPPAQPGAGGGSDAPAAASPAPTADHWIGRLFKALGIEHERGLARLPATAPEKDSLLRKLVPGLEPGLTAASGDGEALPGTSAASSDTVKSLLLQLVRSDEVPAALKETMQQTLQHITGQQLLLTPDRQTPFAHVTMFVPFRDENGEQTASVHIESRRGSRGQLDADNCRLLFDLSMKQMGNTLLDVRVVDRAVSLNVRNDHPIVPKLLDGAREEVAAALHRTGYQLLLLQFGPYPTPADFKQEHSSGQTADSGRAQLKSLYQTKPYKGVDFRV